jgi:DNA-directed RNA polymerase subunit RPC12/RpoP
MFVRGVAAAKAGEVAEDRKYFEWLLRRSPSAEMEIDAQIWLAEFEHDPALKHDQLEDVLALNSLEPRARRALAILNGEITPEKIVDPENLPDVRRGGQAEADRFTCHNCGGRMSYAADGRSLTCDYCEMRGDGSEAGAAPDEQDFILALATIKGHAHPETARTFSCEACGAGYILAAESLTLTCHHCGSVYVVKETETDTWIPPQGVIPFSVTQEQAEAAMRSRLEEEYGITPKAGDRPPVGVYLPAWTFDLGGAITWQDYETDEEG